MLTEFEKKISGFIKSAGLFKDSRRSLVAVSGGADSVALMFALVRLKEAGEIETDILGGHINHNLRGADSEEDQKFVEELGRRLGIEVITRSVGVRGFAGENKLSIETAARKLRSDGLIAIAKENNCGSIVTAHHMDDNAETMVHRLMRGTGFRGLGGIWPGKIFDDVEIVRPMLCIRRTEVIDYCKAGGIKWRDDHTNMDTSFKRNWIRHELIPYLRQGNDGLEKELWKLASSARRLNRRIENESDDVWEKLYLETGKESVAFDRKEFCRLGDMIAVEAVRRAIVQAGSGEKDMTEVHYKSILELARDGRNGKKLELPNGFIAGVESGRLVFYKHTEAEGKPFYMEVQVEIGDHVKFEGKRIEAKMLDAADCDIEEFKRKKDSYVEWFDHDKLKLPVVARSRKEGDKFRPIGGGGEKKVGKFLTAAKVPGVLRREIVIFADAEKIIWLAPFRASEITKVTSGTRKILQLNLS
jgi:tRNA(Ile)-lysidine synthase